MRRRLGRGAQDIIGRVLEQHAHRFGRRRLEQGFRAALRHTAVMPALDAGMQQRGFLEQGRLRLARPCRYPRTQLLAQQLGGGPGHSVEQLIDIGCQSAPRGGGIAVVGLGAVRGQPEIEPALVRMQCGAQAERAVALRFKVAQQPAQHRVARRRRAVRLVHELNGWIEKICRVLVLRAQHIHAGQQAHQVLDHGRGRRHAAIGCQVWGADAPDRGGGRFEGGGRFHRAAYGRRRGARLARATRCILARWFLTQWSLPQPDQALEAAPGLSRAGVRQVCAHGAVEQYAAQRIMDPRLGAQAYLVAVQPGQFVGAWRMPRVRAQLPGGGGQALAAPRRLVRARLVLAAHQCVGRRGVARMGGRARCPCPYTPGQTLDRRECPSVRTADGLDGKGGGD